MHHTPYFDMLQAAGGDTCWSVIGAAKGSALVHIVDTSLWGVSSPTCIAEGPSPPSPAPPLLRRGSGSQPASTLPSGQRLHPSTCRTHSKGVMQSAWQREETFKGDVGFASSCKRLRQRESERRHHS